MRYSLKKWVREMLFGREPAPGRQVYLDYLRVMATVFVIGGHTVSLAASLTPPEQTAYTILEILFFIFSSCNLIFVMMSGSLLLPVRNEKTGTFLAKRFSKVAVPFVVYYVLYVCLSYGMQWLRPEYLRILCIRIFQGAPEEAPHFWLVYVILGLYILTPFLRYIVQHIPDSVFAGVMIVVFAVNALHTYLPIFEIDAHLSVIVNSFVGIFLFGYFINEKCSKKLEDFFIIGGIVSFVISCLLVIYTDSYKNYIYENAPTMMFFAAAEFLLIKRLAKERTKTSLFTRLICKYSFSVLLIHWGILHFLVKQVLHVNVLSFGIVGGCILAAVLTLFFSLAASIVLDNTVVKLLHCIGHQISCGVKSLRRRTKA